MEGISSSFYKSRLCKVTLRLQVLLLLLGFIWFLLLVGVVDSTRTIPPPSSSEVMSMILNPHHDQVTGGFRLLGLITTHGQRLSHHEDRKRLERLKFVSKRRVPNGPDPIHNRRAGNSNQPPGRSQGVVVAEIKGRRL